MPRSIDPLIALSLSLTHTRLLASFSPPVEDEGVDLGDGHLAQDRHFPLFPRELGLPSAAFVLDRVNRVEGLAGDHAETLVRPEGRHHGRAQPNGGREGPVPVKGRGRERRERRQMVRQRGAAVVMAHASEREARYPSVLRGTHFEG